MLYPEEVYQIDINDIRDLCNAHFPEWFTTDAEGEPWPEWMNRRECDFDHLLRRGPGQNTVETVYTLDAAYLTFEEKIALLEADSYIAAKRMLEDLSEDITVTSVILGKLEKLGVFSSPETEKLQLLVWW